ncbi:MAG TPA: glycoside hydrolase family 3 N-terminal domain-containing protein [Treponemataceae bacterium]|nr:glycoside hydrolase family 3 N-terminal domain-containing protein [Treponemataceae bacterium]
MKVDNRRKVRGLAGALASLAAVVFLVSCCASGASSGGKPAGPAKGAWSDASLPAESRAAELLKKMTLDEKIGQMTQADRQFLKSYDDIARLHLGSLLSGGGSGPDENTAEAWADMYDEFQGYALKTRLGIPLVYGVDAVHGHNNVRGATIFPHNIGLGAANDPDLVERIARATAVEVAATGIDWNFAPCLTVPQDIRWGRTYEGYSENPEIVSVLGSAAVRGYQGTDLAARDTILATIKHFVADGGTFGGKDRGDAKISEEELRSIHLHPYFAAIGAGAGSLMPSFSSWNGVRMHAHGELLTGVLRGEMGFAGFTISDWAALDELGGTPEHRIALGINSGVDMVMVPEHYESFITTLKKLVKDGAVSEARVDEAVLRILTAKFKLGLFESPLAEREFLDRVGSPEHRAVAREAVRKSAVLLKNDGILPLKKENLKAILVTGPLADNLGAQCGGWTISWQGGNGPVTEGTTVLAALRAALPESVAIYDSLKAAEKAGAKIDAAVVVVGERPYAEWQGDTQNPALPPAHSELIETLSGQGLPVVTVLFSGRPLLAEREIAMSSAFLAAWLPGTEGAGLADLLLGDAKPTGKLSFSWPKTLAGIGAEGKKNEKPLFELGYGLSW